MLTTTTTKTMKAAQGKDYGDIDKMIYVDDQVSFPNLEKLSKKQRKSSMIIETHAVALACGDCRVLSGDTREFQGPPEFPYIPCGDAAGVVVEIPKDVDDFPFKVGDRVAARFVGVPRGALAEYSIVSSLVCEKIPENVSYVDAAALASSCPALLIAERIQPGERVLILGAGGGVGSHTCQIMKSRGAKFICGVSRSPERLLCAPLSYDRAIDYTKQNVFSLQEFKDEPFDTILDLSSGGWLQLLEENQKHDSKSIVKPASKGGRYLTITPDTAHFMGHSILDILKPFLFIPLWRALKSRLWKRRQLPRYSFTMSLPEERSIMTKTMDLAEKRELKAVVDNKGPFPLTTNGVRKAFRLQESRHIHGKVIVQVRH